MGKQILKRKAVKEATLVRYLLGYLSKKERLELEEMYFADDDLYEALCVAEHELIDRYIYGELSRAERKRFESHFLAADGRRQKTRLAQELKQGFSKSKDRASQQSDSWAWATFTRPLTAVLSLILAAGLGVATWQTYFRQSEADKGMDTLKKAYQNERPLEARISGFDYAPESKTRGGQENIDQRQLKLAERILLEAVVDSPSSESHHALGAYYLADKQFDKALNEFQEALATDQTNARLHNDMGIALLEIGKRDQANQQMGKSTENFAESLDHFSKALELDGSFLEALFNRALCHRYLNLLQHAQDDWQLYIEKDSKSPWADEARYKLESIKEERKNVSRSKEEIFQDFLDAYAAKDDEKAWKAFSQSSTRAGNYIITKLLDAYVALSPQRESGAKIEMLSFAGRLVNRKVGDRFALDLSEFYKRTNSKQREMLASAQASMRAAYELLNKPNHEAAYNSFKDAKLIFDQVGDECESSVAKYWLATCDLPLNRFEQSFSLFSELVESCRKANYKWLQVRALNGLANNQFLLNEYSKALGCSLQSKQVAEQAQDLYGLVFALLQLIEENRHLGNYRQSLSYIQSLSALAGSNSFEANQVCTYYGIIAWTLNSLNLQVAAIDFQKAALDTALELGETSMICVSYIHLGVMQAKLKKFDEALKIAQQAYEFASKHANEAVGPKMMAYSRLQIGNICRQAGKLDEAIASYNESIELYSKLQALPFIYQGHKGMLLSYFASGDIVLAKEELDITLELDKKYRSKILEEHNRNRFFDMEQDVFDLAIDFEYSIIKDDRKACEYSEESRARSLWDSMNTKTRVEEKAREPELTFSPDLIGSTPRTLADIQLEMPDQMQLIQYAILKDKLLIWVISNEEFKSFESQISSDELGELVKNYLRLLTRAPSDKSDEASQLAKRLYDILISPAAEFLKKEKWLCIVPDKILNYIPFYALVSPASGEYLIKDYTVMTAPSSTVFLACCDTARRKKQESSDRLFAVGNQYFDPLEYPELPEAAKEVRALRAFYSNKDSRVLVDANASIAEITKEMEQANVIHFASHSVINPLNPMKSKLLLGRRPKATGTGYEGNGALQAADIYKMNLTHAQLVVLSACETGIESTYRGEGAISLARPFIVRGVPLVVASLWRVDLDATKELMVKFHTYRQPEGQSIKALRRAQLEMLAHPVQRYHHPYYWAAFNLIGGYAEF